LLDTHFLSRKPTLEHMGPKKPLGNYQMNFPGLLRIHFFDQINSLGAWSNFLGGGGMVLPEFG